MATTKTNTRTYLLIELLQSFTSKELSHFNHFLSNDYFNKDQRIVQLFKLLKKIIIGEKAFDITAQTKMYQKIFSDIDTVTKILTAHQKKLLFEKMSKLKKLAEQYLMIEALEGDPISQSKLLNKKLLEKKQYNLFNRLINQNKKQLESQPVKGLKEYALLLQIEEDKLDYLYQKGIVQEEDNFLALTHNLDMYYLLKKLNLNATIYSMLNATQKSYNFPSLEVIATLLDIQAYGKNPLVILYEAAIDLMQYGKESTYDYLLILLEKYASVIPRNYLIDFYAVASNFCSLQIRLGHEDYNEKVFHLHKIIDQEALLVEKGNFIDTTKLKNIITISSHLKEFTWAAKIIEKYLPYVEKEYQESVQHLSLGIIEFYKSNYKTAIHHFIRVEKINLIYYIDCKILLLKAHYELDKDYDERTVQIFRSTEKVILSKKSIHPSHKKGYKHFIQILINLYRVRHRVGKQTVESVYAKMEKMKIISSKKWLLEKMKEIGLKLPSVQSD